MPPREPPGAPRLRATSLGAMAKAATKRTPVPTSGLDRFFKITERGSSVEREIRGGVVTFFTMAYIVVLNPLILGFVKDANGQFLGGGAAPNLPAIAAGTALVAGVMTILMGVFANFPLALATGLGLNAFVAFSIATKMTWADAMGLVVLEGIIILILVLTGFRTAVFHAVPAQLKIAISVGIGLFIAMIGLVDAGFIRRTGVGPVPVELGVGGTLSGWPVLVFCLGLLLVVGLWVAKVRGAILLSIIITTVVAIIVEAVAKIGPTVVGQNPDGSNKVNPLGWNLNVPALPEKIVDTPNLATVGQFNLFGSFGKAGLVAAALLVFTLMLADFFDTMGTMTAIGAEAVGFLMMQQVKGIDWDDLEIAIPAFLTIILMPFTYSITVGIGAGFIAYVFIKAVRGKTASIHPLMWLVSALFVLYFAIDPLKRILGAG